jgi:hypothetical protein
MISSGSLFTRDYLEEAITSELVWNDASFAGISARIGKVFANFPTDRSPNEAQTEGDLIWPILEALGWQPCSGRTCRRGASSSVFDWTATLANACPHRHDRTAGVATSDRR